MSPGAPRKSPVSSNVSRTAAIAVFDFPMWLKFFDRSCLKFEAGFGSCRTLQAPENIDIAEDRFTSPPYHQYLQHAFFIP